MTARRVYRMEVLTADGVPVRVTLQHHRHRGWRDAQVEFRDLRWGEPDHGWVIAPPSMTGALAWAAELLSGPVTAPLELERDDVRVRIDGATMALIRHWIETTQTTALRIAVRERAQG